MDAAIAERDGALSEAADDLARAWGQADELEQVAQRLSERVVERERELRAVRAELDRARAESDEAVRAIALLVERLGGESRAEAEAAPAAAEREQATPNPRPAPEPVAASGNGRLPGIAAGNMFAGLVEVEVGPLSDFAQLVGFEDAAEGIGAAAEISVKRFTKGRATLELHLREPVELLRELEERAPFEFRVRDTRADRVVLDVDTE